MLKKYYLISLGCAKNLTDSESMAHLLENAGYVIADDIKKADLILINTCSFIQEAKEEAVREILYAAGIKKYNENVKLIVAGCLAQRYPQELKKEIPQIDALIGTGNYTEIIRALDEISINGSPDITDDVNCDIKESERKIFTKRPVAYLKISEGCSRNCTYCIIPKLRGRYRSRKIEDIVTEAKRLSDDGYSEIILIAQDVTLYGIDLYKKQMLPSLIKELDGIENIKRIRLMYAYPEGLNEDIINCFLDYNKLMHYIDMPIQHVNDEILLKMGRRTCKKDIINIYNKLKSQVPDIALRTTFIVGFPGETDSQFEEIVDFINKYLFDKIGVFAYSREEGTLAAEMKNQIKKSVKLKRYNALMKEQQKISKKINNSLIGLKTEVLIYDKIDNDIYLGRTYRDAPDVDGKIIVDSAIDLKIGNYYNCQVTAADEYDLRGTVV